MIPAPIVDWRGEKSRMKLSELIPAIEPLSIGGETDLQIRGLYYDSRNVEPGGLFFALRGAASDGHRFISAALERGAVAVVLEDPAYAPAGVTVIRVADGRRAMAKAAAAFQRFPTASVPLVGITGTNGKTTTTFLIEHVLASAGYPAAVLGTISYRFGTREIPAPNTTPESVDLQAVLRELVDLGAKSAVMEVSSHALEQKRVDGCQFDVGVFTNLTRDHLDYHRDMESYFGSKLRLFSELLRPDQIKPKRAAAVNVDDAYGVRMAEKAACPVITYGLGEGAHVTARDVIFSGSGISGRLITPVGETPFSSRLLGRFNLYNILAAVSAGVALGFPLEKIRSGIEGHKKVPGRLETVENDKGVIALVDYAHTGDALENVLKTVNEFATGRIITVFGCGGDRDRGKRPIMSEIAGRLSDLTVITSDNPRTEDPLAIIEEVKGGILPLQLKEYSMAEAREGFGTKGFVTVPDRREAIRLAIKAAKPADVVLIAGKGHEDYQIVGTTKHHFDDREEAAAAIREK